MRYLKLIRATMIVALFVGVLFFYSPSRAGTFTFTPATQNLGAKTWLVVSYDEDEDDGSYYGDSDEDDGGYDDDGYDDGGDDDGGDDD